MKNNHVVVTGARGFIGRNLCLALSQHGYLVHAIGRGEWHDEAPSSWGISHWMRADISRHALKDLCPSPSIIFHCAGSSSVQKSLRDPGQDFRNTVISIHEACEYAASTSSHPKMVLTSSAAVYGNMQETSISEDHPTHPISPYGCHKLMAEHCLLSYVQAYKLQATVVRLFSVYGCGLRKQLLWDACIKAIRKEFNFFGTGLERRDWIHVSDAVNLLIACGTKDHSNFVVNGGTGISPSNAEFLLSLLRNFDSQFSPKFFGHARNGDPTSFQSDPALARSLGWQPQIRWEVGVQQYFAWFKEQL